MQITFSELRYKEVINVKTGHRLGYVGDLQLDPDSGNIQALIVPEQARLGGVFGKAEDYIVPWDSIRRIGDDIIIIELDMPNSRPKPEKRQGFFA